MSSFRSKLGLSVLIPALVAISPLAAPAASYFNGFETPGSESDFINSANGLAGSNITRVASGGVNYTASSGSFYAEIQNTPNSYTDGANLGESTYTRYGAGVATSPGGFSESVDYYVDLNKWLPVAGQTSGFWIDSTPKSDPAYSDELNFRVSVTNPGTVNVDTGTIASGDNFLTAITQSGWYTFKMTFSLGASGFVTNTLSVIDHGGTSLASFSNQSTLPNGSLIGTSYGDWTTVWNNGFAGDTLAIDNVAVSPVPLPKSAGMGFALLAGIGLMKLRRTAQAV